MASPEETQVLQIRGRDAGQQGHAVAVAEQVVRHLVSRLLREYADKNDTKTPGRLAKSTVYVNSRQAPEEQQAQHQQQSVSGLACGSQSPYRGATPCRKLEIWPISKG